MQPDVIQDILKRREGLTIEFKKAIFDLPENLFDTVCAFLNREGGTILLGMEDNGKISGIDEDRVEQLCKDFANLSNNPNKLDPVFLLQPSVVENPLVTAKELAVKTNLSADGVRYYLKKLKSMRLLFREGPAKGGSWIVKKRKSNER